MGQKVNPNGMRLGIVKEWDAVWFSRKDYANFLQQDLRIRHQIEKDYASAAIARILIERQAHKPVVTIYCGRPGVLLGRKGTGRDAIVAKLSSMVGLKFVCRLKKSPRLTLMLSY